MRSFSRGGLQLMDFESPLQVGTLLRRYKRFLADIVDDVG